LVGLLQNEGLKVFYLLGLAIIEFSNDFGFPNSSLWAIDQYLFPIP
jgi:hypothetical protein